MIGFPLGLLYANAGEWLIHKYVLHGMGRDKASLWSFHWHEHHREARKNEFRDKNYELPVVGEHAQGREAAALAVAAIAHAPLFPVAPFFTSAVWFSIANYYRVHKRSHLDPEWARENLSWHYDHHMGSNQDANWCVSFPWFDWIMGTREKYVGTEREARDVARSKERAARHIAQALAARESAQGAVDPDHAYA
jgi:hypothetical protein